MSVGIRVGVCVSVSVFVRMPDNGKAGKSMLEINNYNSVNKCEARGEKADTKALPITI